jgi:hypothetical protein
MGTARNEISGFGENWKSSAWSNIPICRRVGRCKSSAGLKPSAPKAAKSAQLDGQVISHSGGHFALLSILFEQVYFGLEPKRVGSTIRPTRRFPEFIGAPSNFVFG